MVAVAQLAERWFVGPEVAGSIPVRHTISDTNKDTCFILSSRKQMGMSDDNYGFLFSKIPLAHTCKKCHGHGTYRKKPLFKTPYTIPCPDCKGAGIVANKKRNKK